MWYQQQPNYTSSAASVCCDLLKNIYLCGINNNLRAFKAFIKDVVICLKISTFVVSTTTINKIVKDEDGCDLLKNIYLCGINNNISNK